ncbi:hypothetical protein SERLA73DRAFT_160202, partial [Serpula lacrymans var. lacrymans S7.3]
MIRKPRLLVFSFLFFLILQRVYVLSRNLKRAYTVTMASNIAFPSPVGGVPFPSDFAPSVLFAVLYGLLLPVAAYRIADKRSRTVLLVGSTVFAIERLVIFSLRAVQAHSSSKRESITIAAYMQVTIGLGFIGIMQDVMNLLRCLLVNSTLGPTNHPDTPSSSSDIVGSTSSVWKPSPSTSFHVLDGVFQGDQPRRRNFYRRFIDVTKLTFLVATIPGIIGNAHYRGVLDSASTSQEVMRLRYVSTAVALFLILVVVSMTMWAMKTIPRVRTSPALLLLSICALLSSSAIYRLAVMYNTTTSLTSMSQGSLNTPSEKAEFYIFHMLNEWVALALILGLNVRERFD